MYKTSDGMTNGIILYWQDTRKYLDEQKNGKRILFHMFEATSVFVWLVQQRSLYSLLGMMNAFFGKNILLVEYGKEQMESS